MRNLLFLFTFLFILSSKAQMVDLMGSLSLQGLSDQQASHNVSQGFRSLDRLKIMMDLQQVASEIQTGYFGNYTHITKSSLSNSSFFKGRSGYLDWSLGSIGSTQFFIELHHINQSDCSYLSREYHQPEQIIVNGLGKSCRDDNTMKFIYN